MKGQCNSRRGESADGPEGGSVVGARGAARRGAGRGRGRASSSGRGACGSVKAEAEGALRCLRPRTVGAGEWNGAGAANRRSAVRPPTRTRHPDDFRPLVPNLRPRFVHPYSVSETGRYETTYFLGEGYTGDPSGVSVLTWGHCPLLVVHPGCSCDFFVGSPSPRGRGGYPTPCLSPLRRTDRAMVVTVSASRALSSLRSLKSRPVLGFQVEQIGKNTSFCVSESLLLDGFQ